jgi:hypothetical protein
MNITSIFSTTTTTYHSSKISAEPLLYLFCCVPLEERFRVLLG